MRLTDRLPSPVPAAFRPAGLETARRRGPGTAADPGTSQAGLSLLEVVSALSIFVVLLLSVGLTVTRGMQQRRETFALYRAQVALRNLISDIQETANLPQDLTLQEGIGAIYAKYHNQSFPAPVLTSGSIMVTVFTNETAVPSVLGGPQDLNFDGDANDNLDTLGGSSDLKLIPASLTLTFTEDNVTHVVRAHRLIARTAGH